MATAVAWLAVCAAWAAVCCIQAKYGVTAATMLIDDGPTHGPLLNVSMTEEYDETVDCNSLASPSQAAAAASIDSDPGPAYIRPELNSGGNAP